MLRYTRVVVGFASLGMLTSGRQESFDEIRVGTITFSRELACASDASAVPHRSWSPLRLLPLYTVPVGIGCGPLALNAAGQNLSLAEWTEADPLLEFVDCSIDNGC